MRTNAIAIFCWETPGAVPHSHDKMIDWCEKARADAQIFSDHGHNAHVFELERPANAKVLFDWLDKQRSLPQEPPHSEDE